MDVIFGVLRESIELVFMREAGKVVRWVFGKNMGVKRY
jgi:hypothetical protein